MNKILVTTWALLVLILPGSVAAQGSPKLESLNIELWSEYDQPSMLVINQFIVAKETPLPASITMRFPKDGNLIAVAYENAGSLINTQFESPAEQGNWQAITVSVDSYNPYRIEYYQPLVRDGNNRSFEYDWPGDYSVKNFNVNLILPADSINLKTTPKLSKTEPAANGLFLTGTTSENDLKMGRSYQFEVEYERTSDVLSNPDQANRVQPTEPLGPATSGRISIDNLPWIIGGVGVGLITLALFIYWRSTKVNAHASSASRRRGIGRKQGDDNEARQIYCQECGTRSSSGDRFCRTCGTKLRTE